MLDRASIRAELEPFGIDLSDEQVRQVKLYVDRLVFWNQRINLTSIVHPREIVRRHFGESMFAARMLSNPQGSLLDIGSGAGFPGLALGLACPHLRVFLVESVAKKAAFLAEIVRTLDLTGIEVMNCRVEDVSDLRVDAVTMRAVSGPDRMLKVAGRLLFEFGQVLLWIGRSDIERVTSAGWWDWKVPRQIPGSGNSVVLSGTRQAQPGL